MPKELTVHRKKGPYAMFRKMQLWVDDEKVGEVGNGDSLELVVPDSAKTLIGKMDWGKTPECDLTQVAHGSTISLEGHFTLSKAKLVGIMNMPFKWKVAPSEN